MVRGQATAYLSVREYGLANCGPGRGLLLARTPDQPHVKLLQEKDAAHSTAMHALEVTSAEVSGSGGLSTADAA